MPRRVAAILLLCLAAPLRAADPVGLDALDLRYLSVLRTGTAHLASSADPSGGNMDRGHYLRRDGRRAVLMESTGPGQITRIWSANPQGRLLIWFDGEATPRIDLSFEDLGRAGELTPNVLGFVSTAGGGVSCWYPMPFAKSCRVAVEGAEQLYYQVDYTTWPPGTPVETFAPGAHEPPGGFELGEPVSAGGLVAPGAALTLFDLTGTRTVRRLALELSRAGGGPPPSLAMLRGLRLRMRWDEATGYSVDVPLLDFFASGLGPAQFLSAPIAVAEWSFLTCDFPLPFRHRGRCEVVNRGEQPVQVSATAYVTGGRRLDDGYFHVGYQQAVTAAGRPHPIAKVTGRGHYVGSAVTFIAGGELTHLEGDEQITVDDEQRLLGTGTEDYFDGAWFFRRGPFADPYAGAPLLQAGKRQTAAYRWHIADCVPFSRSLAVELEHGPTNDTPGVLYRSVGYWYAETPQPVPAPPLPDAPPEWREPDLPGVLVEAEGAARLGSAPESPLPALGQTESPLTASGGRLVRYAPESADDPLLIPVTVKESDLYEFELRVLSGGLETLARFRLDDGPIREAGTATLAPGPLLRLGRERLAAGEHTLSLWLAGDAPGTLDVDYLRLTPVGKVARALEVEDLTVTARGGEAVVQTHADLPSGATRRGNLTGGDISLEAVWSGGGQVRFVPSSAGDACEVKFNIEGEGFHGLALGLTRGRGYGAGRVSLDGRLITEFGSVLPEGGEVIGWRLRLGTHHLTDGEHRLRVESIAADGRVRPIGLDYLLALPAGLGNQAELMVQTGGPEGIIKERFGAEPRWSGGAYIRYPGSVDLLLFAPSRGRYRLFVTEARIPTGGRCTLILSGRRLGELDCGAEAEALGGETVFEATLRRGANPLRLEAAGGEIALDLIRLERIGGGVPWPLIVVTLFVLAAAVWWRRRR